MAADKVDFKKTLDCYGAKRGKFEVVNVPDMQYLMIDGSGDPNTSTDYSQSIEALYPVAYKLKFASKKELGRDYVVPPLEALWWADDMASFTTGRDKSKWRWTLMLMTPDWVDQSMVDTAMEQAREKAANPKLDKIRLQTLSEGECIQTLHIGSFDDEGPVLDRMHNQFIPEQGLALSGKHHEIYFSDFRKVAPEKLRTILRQPVARLTT
ncbi:MAG: GyrI-like domain-containing protein [Candidatus Nanopelagicales bacterium]